MNAMYHFHFSQAEQVSDPVEHSSPDVQESRKEKLVPDSRPMHRIGDRPAEPKADQRDMSTAGYDQSRRY
jgi:hypothetical protein